MQFVSHDGDWLRAEAVGDRYLGDHPLLSADERAGLTELGWNEPDERGGGNYWLEWGVEDDEQLDLDAARHPVSWTDPESTDALLSDAAIADAARLAAMTLCRVFGPFRLCDLVAQAGAVHVD